MFEMLKSYLQEEKEAIKKRATMISELEDTIKLIEELYRKTPDIHDLAKLIDRVDQIGKEVDIMLLKKGEPLRAIETHTKEPGRTEQIPYRELETEHARMERIRHDTRSDAHARMLINMLSNAPGVYTTTDISEMLGVVKSTAIRIMKKAAELDPEHIQLTYGTRKKIFIHYYPERKRDISIDDTIKRELMELAAKKVA